MILWQNDILEAEVKVDVRKYVPSFITLFYLSFLLTNPDLYLSLSFAYIFNMSIFCGIFRLEKAIRGHINLL
jgi:hypothetical protein